MIHKPVTLIITGISGVLQWGCRTTTRLRRRLRPLGKHSFFFQALTTQRGIYSGLQLSLPTCDLKPSDPREAGDPFSFFIVFFAGYFDHMEKISRGCFIQSQFLASFPKRFHILHPALQQNMDLFTISNVASSRWEQHDVRLDMDEVQESVQ